MKQMNLVLLMAIVCFVFLHNPVVSQANAAKAYGTLMHAGMCDASAAVAVGSSLFIVGNDEDNILRLYRRDGLEHGPIQSFDLSTFLNLDIKHPEADIEAATRIGDRVYWITSHGANKKGKQRSSRHKFFATQIKQVDSKVSIEFIGHPYESLVNDLNKMPQWRAFALLEAAHYAPKSQRGLNIEGLAAAPDGSLWIAFRNPVPDAKALLVSLKNPQAVVTGEQAILGEPLMLSLHGLGIRGMEYVPRLGQYIIIAGSFGHDDDFRIYRWSGMRQQQPVFIKNIDLGHLKPESVVVYGDGMIQLLSDDGTNKVAGKACKRVENADKSFRSMSFTP